MFLLIVLVPFKGIAQSEQPVNRYDSIIFAAKEIINRSPFCALVTIDSSGQSQVRTMNPFPLKDDWVIWFATSRNSRKVTEIRNNPSVSVYYADHTQPKGYVNFNGTAEIIDDQDLLLKMKRDYWDSMKGWQDVFVLIRIIPKTMDVINYERGIVGQQGTNRSPSVEL